MEKLNASGHSSSRCVLVFHWRTLIETLKHVSAVGVCACWAICWSVCYQMELLSTTVARKHLRTPPVYHKPIWIYLKWPIGFLDSTFSEPPKHHGIVWIHTGNVLTSFMSSIGVKATKSVQDDLRFMWHPVARECMGVLMLYTVYANSIAINAAAFWIIG